MQINISLDTNQPVDLSTLAKLAAALNDGELKTATIHAQSTGGAIPPVKAEAPKKVTDSPKKTAPVPTPTPTPAPMPEPEAETDNEADAEDESPRNVSIAELRAAIKTKVLDDVKGCISKLGFKGLSEVPKEKLAALLDLVNACPNK